MARQLKFLQYQITAYWRRSFSVRGMYDSGSGFFLLIAAGFIYRYASILKQAAKSIAAGGAENLSLILIIIFLAWTLPNLEKQKLSAQTAKFLFLPISKNQFALANLASLFLLPTSIIAAAVSLAAIYPLLFSANIAGGAIAVLIFALSSAVLISAFFELLKIRFFRIAAFLSPIALILFSIAAKIDISGASEFSPAAMLAQIINAENSLLNFSLPISFFLISFLLAFFSARQTLGVSALTGRTSRRRFLPPFKLPLKFGELVKKDFVYSWRMLDSYFSLLAAIFYAILLIFGDFSFLSFSVALAFIVMMNGSLSFNGFGLETASGIERLSLLPVKAEDLLAAKNKAFALVVFSQILFLFPLIFYKFGFPLFISSILKTISIVLLYAAWGNNLSIKHPFKMNFYQLSFGGSISAMLYGVIIISIFIVAPEFLNVENSILKLAFNIFFAAACFLIYRFTLKTASQKLPLEWERIARRLS